MAANERNAVAVVTKDRRVIEVFRNPVNLPQPAPFGVGLRNAGEQSVGNNHILEFQARLHSLPEKSSAHLSLTVIGGTIALIRAAKSAQAGSNIGKISCMDQELKIPGLPLPIDD